MNICYACTKNYYQYMPTVINSVLVNNPKAEIYVFAEDDEIPNINHTQIHILNIDKLPQLIFTTSWGIERYTRMIAYKLAVAKLLPDLDKALFLDVDTLVDGDLTPLYESDMWGYFYGMAQEWSTAVKFKKTYYNAGVVLMNLKTIRDRSIEDMLLNRLNMVNFSFPEQEVLNQYISQGSILELDPKWNFCITSKFPTEKPVIWHYQSSPKAWDKLGNKYIWDKYKCDSLINIEEHKEELNVE